MRGVQERQAAMLLGITTDELIPLAHPIRAIKAIAEQALRALAPVFAEMYAEGGRPSVPPEHLLKSTLLIALYTVPSERRFCERLQYDLLFKWFLDLNIGDPAFDHSTFSKNRQRLIDHAVADQFFAEVVAEAKRRHLLSEEHFTVDGTLIEAWASLKSFRPKEKAETPPAEGTTPPDGGAEPPTARTEPPAASGGKNPDVDFKKEKRTNATHASTTDPEARLMRKGKGKEAKLSFCGHVLMENRNGLVVDHRLTLATGTAEREAAIAMLEDQPDTGRITVGADKGYDTKDFVKDCRALEVTPHVAQKTHSAIDGRTTHHPGSAVSQRIRKRVEEIFGWGKTVGGIRKFRFIGLTKNRFWWTLSLTAYNLVRMSRLPATTA